MDPKAKTAIFAMINSYSLSKGQDIDVLFKTYEGVTRDFNASVLVETAHRFVSAQVQRKHRTFCPSIEEFIEEAHKVKELQRLRSLDTKQIASKPQEPKYTPPTPEEKARVAKLHAAFMRGENFNEATASQNGE